MTLAKKGWLAVGQALAGLILAGIFLACPVPPSPSDGGEVWVAPDGGPRDAREIDAGEAVDSGMPSDGGCSSVGCILATPPLPAPRAYLGPGGVDRSDCTGGTRTNPWRTWSAQRRNGCIAPGDTIVLLPGTYTPDSGVFNDGDPGNIELRGEAGRITTLVADPDAPGPWPVKLAGKFAVFASWAEIRGIEFESPGGQGFAAYPFSLWGHHVTLRGNYFHGRPQDFGVPGVSYDCVKLSGYSEPLSTAGPKRSEWIQVVENEIGTCPEDCVDLAGSGMDILYLRNHVYGCDIGLQAKSGAERVTIEGNIIHDVRAGIAGFGGACQPNSISSCPNNAAQVDIPIEDRFVAKDVVVANNILYSISATAIVPRGWRNAKIHHNTIYGTNVGFRIGNAPREFNDALASAYCATHACDTRPCEFLTSGCWVFWVTARDVEVANNITMNADLQIDGERDSMIGFKASANIYFRSSGAPATFWLSGGGSPPAGYRLAQFPYEQSSFEADPGLVSPGTGDFSLRSNSLARNRGAPIGVACDAKGQRRCDAPDIGAREYSGP